MLRLGRVGQAFEQCDRLTALAGRHESIGANQRAVHNGLLHRRGPFPRTASSALAASGVPISPKALAAAAAASGDLRPGS